MANQEFKKGDRVKITDFTGTIIGTKLVDNSIKYHVKIDQNRIYTWVSQSSLERMVSDADNFKQTITVETERKTGETVIRISNPRFTTDEPTVKGTIVGDVVNKPSEPKITDEQRTVLEGLYLLGYRYLACDKNLSISDSLWVYTTIPYKNDLEKWDSYDGNSLCVDNIISPNILNNLCSWEDEKPTSIEWLLGKKDKNE
jgi:hypothetical protein